VPVSWACSWCSRGRARQALEPVQQDEMACTTTQRWEGTALALWDPRQLAGARQRTRAWERGGCFRPGFGGLARSLPGVASKWNAGASSGRPKDIRNVPLPLNPAGFKGGPAVAVMSSP
jgi:hypothetical protein